MVPHDQQAAVTSPGMIRDELDLVSGFAINRFTTEPHWPRRRNSFARCEQSGAVVQEPWGFPPKRSRAECPRGLHAVNELPQPQDFVEFGFTKTKPCWISVSW